MTLTNRLTAFFLVALAIVLTAFSVALYALAHAHLSAQFSQGVSTTMDTLVALAEIEPDGLDWEPALRRLPSQWESNPPVWAIFDQDGRRVDGSQSPSARLEEFSAPGTEAMQEHFRARWAGGNWHVARQTLRYPEDREVHSRPERKRYRTLVFVVTVPFDPVVAMLRNLAWCLACVSVAVWGLAACVSRWFCRRALAPLIEMSGAAKAMRADNLGERLPLSVTRDELADFAAAFNDLLSRLQDSFERQRRFTGEASHQLRTPLTALLGQVEVALRRDREPEEYRRVLTSAAAQAGRLRRIVEALLFLARADADAQMPGVAAVDLVGWLPRHIAEVWSRHARYGDLRLERPTAETLPVLAEPTLLGQAVDNLLDNAFKYSPPGSPIHVQLCSESDWADVAVKDEGPGIAATDVARVLSPFFRSEDARRRGVVGVGLGLAVAERIVKGFGGSVEVSSEPGRGSCFTIRLPLQNTPAINDQPLLRSVEQV